MNNFRFFSTLTFLSKKSTRNYELINKYSKQVPQINCLVLGALRFTYCWSPIGALFPIICFNIEQTVVSANNAALQFTIKIAEQLTIELK